MRRAALLPLLLLLSCGPRDQVAEPDQEGPPAAAVSRLTGMPLHEGLTLLEHELVLALNGQLDGDGMAAFLRAEAISDRLLETRFPFDWLARDSYSVQARVRQIQSLADRVEAIVRTGTGRDQALSELRRLRDDVLHLRRQLAQGGSARLIPLDRLLAGRDTLNLVSGEGASGE